MTKTMYLPTPVKFSNRSYFFILLMNSNGFTIINPILNNYEFTSSCSSVNESFWTLQVSAWVRQNSATDFVTVDLTGDGSPTKRANKVACSGNQLKQNPFDP